MIYKRKKKKEKPLPLFDRMGVTVKKKPDLKAKLDKEFSLFIRLRDAMPNGCFRCISCGHIKPFEQADNGHYINRQHMSTRFDEINCNAQCRKCLTPDALILRGDFTWKPLGDLKVGDALFAFEESTEVRKTCRRFKLGHVTYLERQITDVYEVEMENGDTIKTTADHQWLARRGNTTGYQWIKTKDLWVNSHNLKGDYISGPFREHVYSTLCKPFRVINHVGSFESGWIAGMIDADGHITQQVAKDKRHDYPTYGLRVGISQSETYPEICKKIKSFLELFSENRATCRQDIKDNKRRSIKQRQKCYSYLITGTNIEKIEFLQRVRPTKIGKIDIDKLGKMRSQYDTHVKSIKYVGKQEIVVMETDTHTFIANGYAMHNCNRFMEGNIQNYRKGLIAKYGEQKVILLEAKQGITRKYSDFEYEQLIKYYKALNKKLKKEKEI